MSETSSSGSYRYVFTTTDCMGRPVGLKEGTFTHKIMPSHPEVTEDMIKDCLESAHYVTTDPIHFNRQRYYKSISIKIDDDIDHRTNIKTVVEDNDITKYSEVVTSYIMSDPKNEITSGSILYDHAKRKSGI